MIFRQEDYPNLNASNHRDIISRRNAKYNCIAWAAGVDNDWWEPAKGMTWPGSGPRDSKVTSLISMYESVGFVVCEDGTLEEGFDKLAIYAIGLYYEHAARQTATGKWSSKMGPDELIEHDAVENLEGPEFGKVVKYMKRKRAE